MIVSLQCPVNYGTFPPFSAYCQLLHFPIHIVHNFHLTPFRFLKLPFLGPSQDFALEGVMHGCPMKGHTKYHGLEMEGSGTEEHLRVNFLLRSSKFGLFGLAWFHCKRKSCIAKCQLPSDQTTWTVFADSFSRKLLPSWAWVQHTACHTFCLQELLCFPGRTHFYSSQAREHSNLHIQEKF